MRTPTVVALTGATYRQVDHWVRCGFITPSVEVGRGTGHVREFSTADAVTISVMAHLVHSLGIAPDVAAVLANGAQRFSDVALGTHPDCPVAVAIRIDVIREAIADAMDLGRVT